MRLGLFKVCLLVTCLTSATFAQRPPAQPATGPGGQDYSHGAVKKLGPFYPAGYEGSASYRYFIYQPDSPKPANAPVALLLHGYSANVPEYYDLWYKHLARKGYVIIWAQFDNGTWDAFFDTYAATSYRDALKRMDTDKTGTFVKPMRGPNNEILSGIIGHSLGAYLAAGVAVLATEAENGIPIPKGIFMVNPSPSGGTVRDYSRVSANTKLIMVVGEEDTVVCDTGAGVLWPKFDHIPASSKAYLVARSDYHGANWDLVTQHGFPTAYPVKGYDWGTDPLDYFITFKLGTAVLNCTLKGTDCAYLSAGSPEQIDMGVWSDGQPVKKLSNYPAPEPVTLPCEDSWSPGSSAGR